MNGRNLYPYLFVWLCICSLTTHSLAQTIITGSITPSTICPGGAVTVTFTTSGTFAAGNTFSAQMSNAAGVFSTTPTIVGSVASVTAVAISATIPTSTINGSYKIRVVSSATAVIGAPSEQALTINVPSPPGTNPIPYCMGQTASALTAAGTSLKWYTAPTGGSALAVTPTPSTTAVGSTTYYVSQTVNDCESDRANLVVTVYGPPAAPGVTNPSLCLNDPSSPLTATGGNLKWYDVSDKLLNEAPTPNTSVVGPQIFKVTQTSAQGCVSSPASITVTIKPRSTAPLVSTPAPYCQGEATQPLSATGSTLLWYSTNETGGGGSTIPTTPSTDTPGSKSYYVTQNTNGCESNPRTNITVTVKSKPGQPGTNPIPYCMGQTASALTAAGTSLKWYTAPTGGSALAVTPTPSTTAVGSTTYYVSQTVNDCESDRANLVVTVYGPPAAPGVTNPSLCLNDPSSPLTATGGNLKWYDVSDKLLNEAPTPNTSVVGPQIFKVTQTSAQGCVSSPASITVTIKPLPVAPTVANLSYCLQTQDQPAQNIAALTASGTALKWYNADGNFLATAPTPSLSQAGVQAFKVTQTIDRCESPQATLQVTVGSTAMPTVANANLAYCARDQARPLEATAETGASLRWITLPSAVSTTAPTPPTTAAGNQGYAVYQIGQNGCYSTRVSITVTIKELPSPPVLTATSFCNTSAASPLTASGQGLRWYDATGNFLSGGAPTPSTTTVGDQIFRISQTVNNCEGDKAELKVTIKPLPVAPTVANLSYCLQTQDQPAQNIAALTASGTQLKWFNTDGNQFPTAPTPSISQVGAQSFQVSQTVNGCEGDKATLQVNVRTTAVPTVTKTLVTYCINDKAVPLEATAESGGSLRWVNPYGQVTNEAPYPSTLNTSIQAGGDPFYVYQVGQNGCYSARSTIKVLVNALPTLSLIPAANSINLGQRVGLQLKFTSAAPYSYTLTDGLSGVVNRADTTISILPRATTTYQIITVKNSCGVGLPGNPATATIVVRVPTVTTSALTTSTLCVGTSLTVPFTTTGEFNTGNAFRVELISVADTTKKYGISTTAAASPVTAPLPLTLVGGQYYVRVKADNPEIGITGSNSPTLLTVRPQATATLTGTQNIYEGYPASLTLTFAGESPWTVVYADSVRSYSATATSSPYAVEVRPSRTTTYRLVSVANVCGNGPISGTATVSVLPLLGVDDNPLDPLVKTYPIPTTSVLTIELDLPLTRDPATLVLSDGSGRPVLQQTTRNRKQDLDLTSQPSGLYLLRIQVGDRQTVRKVLKQ